tara:strand:+ start:1659 stop:1964 length:306 start_codon:yes stop_codon:yes gene_type:complete
MGLRTVGFGNILDEIRKAEEDVWVPNFSTVIECEKCETKLYYHDLVEGKKVKPTSCECGAIKIEAIKATLCRYDHFIGVKPTGVKPKIYEVPYEEYLKTKE